jgi:O-acetyl-ADP-ribose deacetylase (regulator of RNase III)
MGSAEQVLIDAIAFLQSALASVSGIKGLAIALLGAYYLADWQRVFAVALGAMAADVVIDAVIPVAWSGAMAVPPFADVTYGAHLLKLYAGYLIVISVFFLVKSLLKEGRP